MCLRSMGGAIAGVVIIGTVSTNRASRPGPASDGGWVRGTPTCSLSPDPDRDLLVQQPQPPGQL